MCDLRPEEFGPVEPRTWEFARVEFRPMMGRDSQGGLKWVKMGRNSLGRNSTRRKQEITPLMKKIDLFSALRISPRRSSAHIWSEILRGEILRAEDPVPHLQRGGILL